MLRNDDDKSSKPNIITSPYFLGPNNNSRNIITNVIFHGDNYEEWARSICLALRARCKFGFIDGTHTDAGLDYCSIYGGVVNYAHH